MHAGQQLARRERLHDVVVGESQQAADHEVLVGPLGDDDQGQLWLQLPDLLPETVTVVLGQRGLDQNDVHALRLEHVQGRLGLGGRERFVAVPLQQNAGELELQRILVEN